MYEPLKEPWETLWLSVGNGRIGLAWGRGGGGTEREGRELFAEHPYANKYEYVKGRPMP